MILVPARFIVVRMHVSCPVDSLDRRNPTPSVLLLAFVLYLADGLEIEVPEVSPSLPDIEGAGESGLVKEEEHRTHKPTTPS